MHRPQVDWLSYTAADALGSECGRQLDAGDIMYDWLSSKQQSACHVMLDLWRQEEAGKGIASPTMSPRFLQLLTSHSNFPRPTACVLCSRGAPCYLAAFGYRDTEQHRLCFPFPVCPSVCESTCLFVCMSHSLCHAICRSPSMIKAMTACHALPAVCQQCGEL